jgi:hypothetical protein
MTRHARDLGTAHQCACGGTPLQTCSLASSATASARSPSNLMVTIRGYCGNRPAGPRAAHSAVKPVKRVVMQSPFRSGGKRWFELKTGLGLPSENQGEAECVSKAGPEGDVVGSPAWCRPGEMVRHRRVLSANQSQRGWGVARILGLKEKSSLCLFFRENASFAVFRHQRCLIESTTSSRFSCRTVVLCRSYVLIFSLHNGYISGPPIPSLSLTRQ